ncbi:DUF6064 family protein [Thalassospira sp. MA62]|nr:DUF6064 family protein [Thalassospira sp. MA62]
MSEWWSYSLADLLLFSPRVYFRLFESMNSQWWLVVASMVLAGLIAAVLALRPGFRGNRIILVLLALIWAWVSYCFMWLYYQPINWMVPYVLPGFVVQAVLLGSFAARPLPLRFGWRGDFSSYVGLAFLIIAIVVWPFVGLLEGRELVQAELFGSAPDATALGTIGFVLLARGTRRWILLLVPGIWCVIASATLWVMDQQIALVPLVAAWLTVFCGWLDLKNGVTSRRMTEAELAD